ncbi:hypothetical protein H4582DRAFT_2068309 [Lactarius indigo]|nr:hypothetical protein H4582DRAFT_2068309 [Lactarius indigo]
MLFGRAGHEDTAFPPFLGALLEATVCAATARDGTAHLRRTRCYSRVPVSDHEGARARQAIVNLYRPGEGIAPHVDLLNRFGDGIIGVSLGGGVAMRFARVEGGGEEVRGVVAAKERDCAYWGGAHVSEIGFEEEGGGWQWHYREPRVSVTFRWLLPGAEIVGESDSDGEDRRATENANGKDSD